MHRGSSLSWRQLHACTPSPGARAAEAAAGSPPPSTPPSAPPPAEASPPAPALSAATRKEAEWVVEVLVRRLRYARDEARDRVAAALEALAGLGREPTGDEIFQLALGRKAPDGDSARDENRRCGGEEPEADRS